MASLDALILHGAGTITGAVGVGDTTISIQVPQSADLSGSTPVPFAGQDVLIGTEDVRIVTVLSSITHGSNYDYHLTIAPLKNAHAKGTSATFRPYIQRIDVPDPVIIEVGQTLRVNWSDYWKVWGTSRVSFSGAGPTTNVYTSSFFHNQYADVKATGVGASSLDLYLTILLVSGYRFPDSLPLSIGVIEVNQPPVITHTFAPLIFVPGRVTTRTVTPGNHFSDPNNHALTYTATVPSELTATDNGDGTWTIALDAAVVAPASGGLQWQATDTRGGVLLANQTYTAIANRAPIILKQLPEFTEPIGATAHSVYDANDYIRDGGDGETLTYHLEITDPIIGHAVAGDGTDIATALERVVAGYRYPLPSDGRFQLRGDTAGQTTVTLYGRDSYSEVATAPALFHSSTPPSWLPIPDQTVEVDQRVTIELSSYAMDVDAGDTLTYGVGQPPPHVEALIVGSRLYLRGRAEGDVMVQVEAEDQAGLLVSSTFTLTVTPADRTAVRRPVLSPQTVSQHFQRSGQSVNLLIGVGDVVTGTQGAGISSQSGRVFTPYELKAIVEDWGKSADITYGIGEDPQEPLIFITFATLDLEREVSTLHLLELGGSTASPANRNFITLDGNDHQIVDWWSSVDADESITYRALCKVVPNVAALTYATTLAPPLSLAATVSGDEITVTFDNPNKYNGQYRYREESGTFGNWGDFRSDLKELVLFAAKANTEYIIELRFRLGSQTSGGARVYVTTDVGAPQDVVYTPGEKSVAITFTNPGGLQSVEYRYKWSSRADSFFTDWLSNAKDITRISLSGLTPSTQYTFEIRFLTTKGPGPATRLDVTTSTPASATDPPQPPTSFAATPLDKSVELTWANPADASITDYELKIDSGSWTIIGGSDASTVSYTVTGLTNDQEYTFRLRAVNAHGTSTRALVKSTPKAPSFVTFSTPGVGLITGIWSDGKRVYVGDEYVDSSGFSPVFKQRIRVYFLNGTQDKAIELGAGTQYRGMYSDGTTVWMAGHNVAGLKAFTFPAFTRDASKDIATDGRLAGIGFCADGTTAYVYSNRFSGIGITMATGQRAPNTNLVVREGRTPAGSFTDGTTLWIIDTFLYHVFAYKLRSPFPLDSTKSFSLNSLGFQYDPGQIFKLGDTMLISDDTDPPSIRAFNYTDQRKFIP